MKHSYSFFFCYKNAHLPPSISYPAFSPIPSAFSLRLSLFLQLPLSTPPQLSGPRVNRSPWPTLMLKTSFRSSPTMRKSPFSQVYRPPAFLFQSPYSYPSRCRFLAHSSYPETQCPFRPPFRWAKRCPWYPFLQRRPRRLLPLWYSSWSNIRPGPVARSR